MNKINCEFLIIGGGMVGLSIANQLIKRGISKDIIVLDKEKELGLHSSGRNSGVLHAGLYYKPDSIKAKVCVKGSKLLRDWIEERGLPLNPCGKVIVPQHPELDSQLDLLASRGTANGAVVEFLDDSQLKEIIPEARSSSGRALWSPNTVVVKPRLVLLRLQDELKQKGVKFINNIPNWLVDIKRKEVNFSNNSKISYGFFINCAGLQADRVAHQFGIGKEYSLLPFKGLYWQLKVDCPIKIKTNLYPVPDLNVPFLGVHFTPSADPDPKVSIGPTATFAWGRENYQGLSAIEPAMALGNLALLANQYVFNRGGFRNYVHQQAFLSFPPLLLRAAQQLIPKLQSNYFEFSDKRGIRSQLFNHKTNRLEDDFLCVEGPSSLHVLNAISPAFTASFELADLIINQFPKDCN